MNFGIAFFIGYRYWRVKKSNSFASFITFFAVSGIFLGVAALILVSSVMNGLEGNLKNKLLGTVPHVTVSTAKPMQDWKQKVKQVEQLSDVNTAIPSTSIQGMLQSSADLTAVQIFGVYPSDGNHIPTVSHNIYPGALSDLVSGKYRIILGQELARKLKVRIGDKIRLVSSKGVIYSPLGPVPSQRKFVVASVFETGSQVDANVAYIHYKDARRMMRRSPSKVSELRLFMKDPFYAPEIEPQLAPIFPEQKIQVTDWRQTYGSFFGAVRMENNMMSLMLSLIVLVAAFNIISALVMMVTDKTTDVAVLKTQGLSSSNVMAVFMVQGTFNAVIGLVGGLIVGVILSFNINSILNALGLSILGPGMALPVDLEWQRVITIAVGTLILSFVATIYPALQASKIEPANALRYE
ncbi:lipoprotein-releasing ABC transporter permease subunit [Parashewanella curva]|uniref:Lipoprotein-releasing ABC transporter permease subunit n=1 Tax=Parashewanella curva TaxID=2338552 RepID=A0A3L8PY22_9GAMM|nr:lipoprotein-releasing ABC transporter permease subunit [Parashewanella curva]RLV59709.1 lipoprotein-releasing ABC transporter permease subunit [Parashewanella curva]